MVTSPNKRRLYLAQEAPDQCQYDRHREHHPGVAFGCHRGVGLAAVVIALPQLLPGVAFDASKTGSEFLKNWRVELPTALGAPAVTFDALVAFGRGVVLGSIASLVLVGLLAVGLWILHQRSNPSARALLVGTLRGLVDAAVSLESLRKVDPHVNQRLDAIDSQACLILDRLRSNLQRQGGSSSVRRLLAPITWLFGPRNERARNWIQSTNLVLGRMELFSFDWSNPPPLPRFACILRYVFQDPANALNLLALSEAEFRGALQRAGFTETDVESLRRWLDTPDCRIAFLSIDVSGLADLLSQRGVAATQAARTPSAWSGALGY